MKEKCTAVVLAAGSGKRMQSDVAKQYLLLNEKPVLWYALQVFEKSEIIDDLSVAEIEESGRTLIDIVKEKYDYRADRIGKAIRQMK